jgi:hypothetical protein
MNWDNEAVAMATHVGDEMFPAHRGAMPWRQLGISVVFGNDGYAKTPWVKDEVARVRELLGEYGIKILGFGLDPEDDYSWAMLVESSDVDGLNSIVWVAWQWAWSGERPDGKVLQPGAFAAFQIREANKATAESGIKPDHSAN